MRALRFTWAIAVLLVGAVIVMSFASSAFLFFKERSANSRSAELHRTYLRSENVAKHVSVVIPIDTLNRAASGFTMNVAVTALRSALRIDQITFRHSSGFPEVAASFVLDSKFSDVPTVQGTFSARVEVTKSDQQTKLNVVYLDIETLRIVTGGFDISVPRMVSRIISAAGLALAGENAAAVASAFEFSEDVSARIPNVPSRIGGSGVTFGFSVSPISFKAALGDLQVIGDGEVVFAIASIANGG
ncbi:hypothetical protein CN198_33890 [Sinorhizobium meliloti]|uniref:hypothetical protein n=1 Tax=Rhizobium meliloti TaxID=382 RepID=UPI000FD7A59F|nr:hypothetical protein [Sinorhizobium meliloti]MDW9503304.1 hypothetical protein [Sinorhizobium meliloti]MDW9643486.1 hypothetical protein [Sinorhizobium meliloti]MDX0028553.1 hypothetical protein [Sinorhizobium meliloti]MDX0073511.1 hypothetical protein [Sinorhizobium meliloti]RVH56939.1 hypothetical protein CN198_33890 [Sinorhizobium meliloti]